MKTLHAILLVVFMMISLLVFNSCGKDDNCTEQTWYQDLDGDDFGNPNNTELACEQPEGYVADNSDFNDNNASAYPGANEICDDGIDNDNNGFTDCEDFECLSSEEIECNCSDGIDNDGDGFTDCEDFNCEENSDC